MRFQVIPLLVVTAMQSGCTDPPPTERRMIDGYVQSFDPETCLHGSVAPEIAGVPRWQLSREAVFQLGPEYPDGSDALFLVTAVHEVGASLLIVQAQSPPLLVDRITGEWQSIGAEGDGPGEFRSILSAHPFGGQDSLLVLSLLPRRGSVFTREGQLIRTFSMAEVSEAIPRVTGSDGSSLWVARWENRLVPDSPEPSESSATVYLVSPTGSVLSRLSGLHATNARPMRLEAPGGHRVNVSATSPFSAGWSFVHTDSTFIVGHGSAPILWELDPGGEVVGSRCLPLDERRLSEAALGRGLERAYPDSVDVLPGLDYSLVREEAARLQNGVTYPFYRRLLLDDLERLWVERFPEQGGAAMVPERARFEMGGSSEWWVVTREGTIDGILRHPEEFNPQFVTGDTVVGILRGAYGEEAVVGHLLEPEEG